MNQPTEVKMLASFNFAAKEALSLGYPRRLSNKLFDIALMMEATSLTRGNRVKAAALLGCGRNTLGRMLPPKVPTSPARKPVQPALKRKVVIHKRA